MAENSNIEWTDHTFNPWIGCTKVSAGCANCYAETLNNRMKWTQWGEKGKRVRTSESNWKQPLKWNREAEELGIRKKVFCASLADWLDPKVPPPWRNDLLSLIMKTPWLDWQLLSKRPLHFDTLIQQVADTSNDIDTRNLAIDWIDGIPPRNVWIGTSAEDQKHWNSRSADLFNIPAIFHFVSAEPLLGPINLGTPKPDWLIVGGESGPKSRPIDPEWVQCLRDQCNASGHTAFFFKQWGGVNKKANGRLLDGKTFSEFPESKVNI